MAELIKFSWRDPGTALVHAVRAEIEFARRDLLLGSNVRTVCGLQLGFLPDPELSNTSITCAFCREGDWLPSLIAFLPPAPRYGMPRHDSHTAA